MPQKLGISRFINHGEFGANTTPWEELSLFLLSVKLFKMRNSLVPTKILIIEAQVVHKCLVCDWHLVNTN